MKKNKLTNINSKRKKKRSFFSKVFRYIFCLSFCGIIFGCIILLYYSKDLPDLQNLQTEIRTPSVVIQTYDGEIVGSYGDLYENVVKVSELPKHVVAAFMAVEDRRFFSHFGIDFIGFLRAAYNNYVAKRVVQGGSTITQQLAKNILIAEKKVTHYDRSFGRKIKELLLAFWLEYSFSKSDIMMMYLNRVYFGAGTYGIDAAARKYFEKSAKELTIFESAVLAGILKAPSKYSPTNHPNYAYERALVVLGAMEKHGFIKNAKDIEEREGKTALNPSAKSKKDYMYFCDYVYDQAKKLLGSFDDDIVIVSTFDREKQDAAEESIKFYFETESETYKFSQAAFICMARDGAIQAIIGGRDYGATQFNRATQAERMPGSAFKAIIYAAALKFGFQPHDMIDDTPVSIAGWNPQNYKWQSKGQISLLDGFAFSVNSVSVRLVQAIGLSRVAKFAKELGIYNVSQHDLSVALGTTPVTLKDLTSAYASFMDGNAVWPYCIIEIRTKSGKILYQRQAQASVQIIDKEVLGSMRMLLRRVISSGTGRAANVNEFVYGKTGTNGNSDAYCFVLYDPPAETTKGCVMSVWIGNDNNKDEMAENSTGGRIPARIIARTMTSLLTKKPEESQENEKKENPTEDEEEHIIKGGLANSLLLE